ncbi:hypothetical protein ALC60_10143 [Trachymyrmex zeteki]|uniref:Helix-turn-helix domain-containing protein n=1 Tax=Mycetomoellerius zeteki TaxID=64791 RepID=A0A151WSH3_9HYME|nr:hypothetical protein ALC60_10143 [Trachymyrmex zeteki]
MQFTMEVGTDGKLSFLDTTLIMKEQMLVFDVHRKATFSGKFLNFNSHHPLHKRRIIYGSVDKIIRLCYPRFQQNNFINANNIFLSNDYPHIDKKLKCISTCSQDYPVLEPFCPFHSRPRPVAVSRVHRPPEEAFHSCLGARNTLVAAPREKEKATKEGPAARRSAGSSLPGAAFSDDDDGR